MRTTLLLVVVAVSACGKSSAPQPAGADAASATAPPPVVAAPDAGATLPTRDAMRATVDAVARPLVEGGWAPGLIVVLVDEQGETFLPYGKLRADGAPVDADTIFEIGSVTKVFTGLLLAQMVGDGRARLDKPVSVMLPPGTKVPTKDGREITLVELTTHRSGLPSLPDDFSSTDAADAARSYASYDAKRLYAFLARHVLEHAPGEHHAYSNLGVALLGHALSLHAGRSYERLVLDGIARPLGMTSTWFAVPADARARFAQGHDDGGLPAPEWRFDVLAPAGALRSTARDLARFVRAQLGLGGDVPAELQKAIDFSQEPQADAPPTRIALGWLVSKGGRKRFHNGATGGMRSFVGFDRTGKRGVIVLANGTPDLIDHVAGYLLVTWCGERMVPPEPPPTVVLDAATLDGYVGDYPLNEGFAIKVWREGAHLRARATGPGQGANALFASAKDRFYFRSIDAQLEFERDAGGQVEALVLVQNGQRQRGVRKPAAPR